MTPLCSLCVLRGCFTEGVPHRSSGAHAMTPLCSLRVLHGCFTEATLKQAKSKLCMRPCSPFPSDCCLCMLPAQPIEKAPAAPSRSPLLHRLLAQTPLQPRPTPGPSPHPLPHLSGTFTTALQASSCTTGPPPSATSRRAPGPPAPPRSPSARSTHSRWQQPAGCRASRRSAPPTASFCRCKAGLRAGGGGGEAGAAPWIADGVV